MRRSRVTALVVAILLVVGGCGVALSLQKGRRTARATDLLSQSVSVIGCPHHQPVQVAVRTVTRSTRLAPPPPRGLVSPKPSATPSPTASPTPSPTPSPSPSPTPTAAPTATPTATPTAGPTRGTIPTPTRRAIRARAEAAPAPLPVRASISNGRFHLSGLKAGELYQLGAKVPGCRGAKVVVPRGGFFVAGRTQAPAIAVVAPPKVTPTAGGFTWDGGPGTAGATWQLSAGDDPTDCRQPAAVLAHGTLKGASGRFAIPRPATAKAYGGSLHLRVIRTGVPCVPSSSVRLPLVTGLPQDGETQLEVYDFPRLATELYGSCDVCTPGPYDPGYWAGSSAFDWTNPADSTRPFQWSTSAPGTTDGEWQLSAQPLPPTCQPGGVLQHGSTGFKAVALPLAHDNVGSPPIFTLDLGTMQLDQATTYYLRVVPRGAQGACTGPASAPVTLSFKPTPTNVNGCPPTCLPTPKPPPPIAHLVTQVVGFQKLTGPSGTPPYCFQALADHQVSDNVLDLATDAVGFLAVGSGGSVAKGQEVCFTPSSGGDDSFWDDVTSVVDVIIDVVSFPAKVYDLYEQIIPNILAELIPGCDDTCRGYLLTAEKLALTAVGLPPSLPDASRLVNDGEDYLVEQAADATGVPQSVIEAAYDQGKAAMVSQLSAASSQQTGLTCDWCAFDNGVRAPTVKLLVLHDPTDDPALPVPNRVCVTNSFAFSVPNKYYVAKPLYNGSCAALPKSFPPRVGADDPDGPDRQHRADLPGDQGGVRRLAEPARGQRERAAERGVPALAGPAGAHAARRVPRGRDLQL